MDLKRIVRHLLTSPRSVRRVFPAAALDAIENAIRASEARHGGEICFAVEGALDVGPLLQDLTARERALEVFSLLRVWDTERNNGVLIYLLLADHDVEIVADRGIHAKAGTEAWERICHQMEESLRAGRHVEGVTAGVELVAAELAAHFPPHEADINELPDRPVVL